MISRIRILPWFKCNMVCSYCFYRGEHSRGCLRVEDLAASLERFSSELASPMRVQVTGGEPLLEPQRLGEYLAAVAENCDVSEVAISTNGSCDIDEAFRVLSTYCSAVVFIVTVDALGSSEYRYLRGEPVHGSSIIERIGSDRPYSVVVATPVIPSLSFEEFDSILQLAVEREITAFEVNLVKGIRYSRPNRIAGTLGRISLSFDQNPNLRLFGDWVGVLQRGYVPCKRSDSQGSESIVILPSGDVRFCELDTGDQPVLKYQPRHCRYSHPQIFNICSKVKAFTRVRTG